MQDTTKKLAACEASLKRWQSRLTRAVNAINKLERKRRRLVALPEVGKIKTAKAPASKPAPVLAQCEKVMAGDDDAFTIPPELNRADPLIAERMTAARKKAEEAARHKMPLTGREAMKAIMAVPVTPKAPRKRKA